MRPMTILDRIERRFSRFAIPHLMVAIILGQIVMFVLMESKSNDPEAELEFIDRAVLIPDKVLEGEVWRLFTFLIFPPVNNVVAGLFFWYFLYLVGTTLERYWGVFRFNLYLLVGYL